MRYLPLGCQVLHSGSVRTRFTNCGNQVVEIVGNWREKIWIVATKLTKMGGKKKKRIVMAEIWGEIKKNATFTIFLQQITGD